MQKRWIETQSITTNAGEALDLEYSILTARAKLPNKTSLESYGVKVDVFRKDEMRELVDCAEIADITTNLLEIERLVVLLSRCTVTPTTIYEVLDDYLGVAD